MKIIILCAGSSSRTQLGYPKCLYKFKDGEMLIEKNINKLKKLGFKNKDIILATGFKSNLVRNKTKNQYKYINNINFKKTNMVYSLDVVLNKIKLDTLLILYSDILFEKKCLDRIIKNKKDISTVIDLDWKKKWYNKKNYIDDLEEMKIKGFQIKSLGKKAYNIKGIDGRFIGITKFSKKFLRLLQQEKIIKKILKENKKIDFTNFLMNLIKNKKKIFAVKGNFLWTEFDTENDFNFFESKLN